MSVREIYVNMNNNYFVHVYKYEYYTAIAGKKTDTQKQPERIVHTHNIFANLFIQFTVWLWITGLILNIINFE